jgi:uncharacterized protein (TIGR03437 family)
MRLYVSLLPLLLGSLTATAQVRPGPYRIETVAGSQPVGDGGPAAAAEISRIQGLATDVYGNIYLSDTDHHRVRKVSPAGIITTVAGTGVAGYSGDGGPAAEAQLNLPYGLAVDAAGNLYIADLGNNRVRRVWPDGVITTLIPTTALATPRNLALDPSGNLYISEFDGHRVLRVAPGGGVTTAAGTGHAGLSGDGGAPDRAQLAYPAGIAVDRGGALLIADSGNNRVRRIFSNGTINTILGGSSGTALTTPVAVAVDSQGTIYVGDASPVVRAYSINGRWSDAAGGALPGYSGDGGPATRAALAAVGDLAVDTVARLYIADGMRVRRVDLSGNIATLAGDAYLLAIGDGAAARDATLSHPSAVALDAAGNLTIADTGTQRIRQVSGGRISTLAGNGIPAASTLNQPMGVAADAAGTVWVADTGNDAIRSIGADRRPRVLAVPVRAPRGVCFSHAGVLHIVDTGNGRVLRIGGASTEIVATQLAAPEACALDSAGNLYIAETGAHRIRRLSPAGTWSTVAGTGDAGSDGDEGLATLAHLSFPRGLAVDDAGSIYIADTGGNRVRLVTPGGAIHTIAGTGAAGFSGDGGDARSARLNAPAGLFLDGAGDLYIADSLNDRVRRLVPDAAVAPVMAPVSVVNALSGRGGAVAPGERVRVLGSGFGGPIAAEVRVDARVVPVLVSDPGDLTVQIPEDLAGASSARLEVWVAGQVVGGSDLGIAAAAPGVLPFVLNQDGSVNGAGHRAAAGSAILLFVTGQGQLSQARPALPLAADFAGVTAEIAGAEAAGGAPGVVYVVVRIPGGFLAGGDVPLVLSVGGIAAPPVQVWTQ